MLYSYCLVIVLLLYQCCITICIIYYCCIAVVLLLLLFYHQWIAITLLYLHSLCNVITVPRSNSHQTLLSSTRNLVTSLMGLPNLLFVILHKDPYSCQITGFPRGDFWCKLLNVAMQFCYPPVKLC